LIERTGVEAAIGVLMAVALINVALITILWWLCRAPPSEP